MTSKIEDLPLLLVVPPNLADQVLFELHKYLKYGTFDVLPYIGNWEKRQNWWASSWSQCNNAEGRRIIVATYTVSLFDCVRNFSKAPAGYY